MQKVSIILAALLLCVLPACGAQAEDSWSVRIDATVEALGVYEDVGPYDPSYLSLLGLEHIIPFTSGLNEEGDQHIIYLGIDGEMRRMYCRYLSLFGYVLTDEQVQEDGSTMQVLQQPDPCADTHLVPPEIRLYYFAQPDSFVISYPVGYETVDRVLRSRMMQADLPDDAPFACTQAIIADSCLLRTDTPFSLPEVYPVGWEDDLHLDVDQTGQNVQVTAEGRLKLLILTLEMEEGTSLSGLTLCLLDWYDTDNDKADGGRLVSLPLAYAQELTLRENTVQLTSTVRGEDGTVHVLIPFFYDEDEGWRLFAGSEGTLLEWPGLTLDSFLFVGKAMQE